MKLFKSGEIKSMRVLTHEASFRRMLQRGETKRSAAGGCFSTAYEEVFL